MMGVMSDTPDDRRRGEGDTFDGTVDDVEMPDDVRREAEARVAAATAKYGTDD
jgi:hypothetical protein